MPRNTAGIVQALLEEAVSELKDEMQFVAERMEAVQLQIEREPRGNARVSQLIAASQELSRRSLNLACKLGLIEQAMSYPVG